MRERHEPARLADDEDPPLGTAASSRRFARLVPSPATRRDALGRLGLAVLACTVALSLVLVAIVERGACPGPMVARATGLPASLRRDDPRTRTSGLVRARSGRVPRRPPPEREATREPLRPRCRPRQVEGRLPPLRMGEEGHRGREVRPEPHRRPTRLPRAGGALGERPEDRHRRRRGDLARRRHPSRGRRTPDVARERRSTPLRLETRRALEEGQRGRRPGLARRARDGRRTPGGLLESEAGRRVHPRAPGRRHPPEDRVQAVRPVHRRRDGLLGRAARRREAGPAHGLGEMGHAPRSRAASTGPGYEPTAIRRNGTVLREHRDSVDDRDAERTRSENVPGLSREDSSSAQAAELHLPRPVGRDNPLRIVPLLRVVCAARAGGGPARASGSTRTATGPEHLGPICRWGRTGSWPIDSARSG